MNKYDIDYFQCTECLFLQTEKPYWLKESYDNGAISCLDTGVLERNSYFSKIASGIIYFLLNKNGTFLDYGGGYGILTRMMRDRGFDFYWHDPYAKNILSGGFEGITDGSTKYEALTSFENFEHFADPVFEIEKLTGLTDNIIFSTELLPVDLPKPNAWWYYCLGHGQHVSLYSYKTLKFIAQQYQMNLYSNHRSFHMLTRHKYSDFQFNSLIRMTNLGLSNFTKLPSRTIPDFDVLEEKLKGA